MTGFDAGSSPSIIQTCLSHFQRRFLRPNRCTKHVDLLLRLSNRFQCLNHSDAPTTSFRLDLTSRILWIIFCMASDISAMRRANSDSTTSACSRISREISARILSISDRSWIDAINWFWPLTMLSCELCAHDSGVDWLDQWKCKDCSLLILSVYLS